MSVIKLLKIWIYRRLRSYRWKKIQPLLYKPPRSLLDIGCQELYFYEQLKATYDVTLADNEPRQDCILKEDVQQLSFEDNTFDIVLCQQVLEHVPDPVKAINELRRVAKNQLIITVPYEPFFTLARLGYWEKEHLWAVTPSVLKHYLGKPRYEKKLIFKRYYLGVWDIGKK